MRNIVCYMLCLSCVGAWAENLLANAGFDKLNLDGTPAQWDVFVMPDNGAIGQPDAVAHDGDYAAMLHTPKLYKKEPVNNWSQIIYDDLVGKNVELSGHIRTDKVGSAALWIQCFSKRRSRILSTVSTADEFMLSGTHGWTKVKTSIIPPEGTDFLVVRCVITGQGKAWFDSLSFSLANPDLPDSEPIDVLEPEIPEGVVAIEPLQADVAKPDPRVDPSDILTVSKLMQDTIRRLEKDNQNLINQITEIQTDLDQYRIELIRQSVNIDEQLPRYGKHPIVPHGYSVELDY